MKRKIGLLLTGCALLCCSACATRIAGTVRLLEPDMQPVTADQAKGVVVNMINTSAPLEQASYSVATTDTGQFVSEKGKLEPGSYKIEASRIGYLTATQAVELKKRHTQKVELILKKIPEGAHKALRSADSDQDKIINSGEVNIQPPSM